MATLCWPARQRALESQYPVKVPVQAYTICDSADRGGRGGTALGSQWGALASDERLLAALRPAQRRVQKLMENRA